MHRATDRILLIAAALVAALSLSTPADAAQPIAPRKDLGESVVTLANPGLFEAEVSTWQGSIRAFRLLNEQYSQAAKEAPDGAVRPPDEKLAEGPLDLVSTWDPGFYPYAFYFEDLKGAPQVKRVLQSDPAHPTVTDSFWALLSRDPVFTVLSKTDSSVTMVWPDPQNDESTLFVERTWTVSSDFVLSGVIRVVNLGAGEVSGRVRVVMPQWEPPATAQPGMCGSMFAAPVDVKQVVCMVGDSLEKKMRADLLGGETGLGVAARYVAVDSRYFLLATVPEADQVVQCMGAGSANGAIAAVAQWEPIVVKAGSESCLPRYVPAERFPDRLSCLEAAGRLGVTEDADVQTVSAAYSKALTAAATGEDKAAVERAKNGLTGRRVREVAFRAFAGPKDIDQLKSVGAGLEETIDFWIVGILAKPMLWLMRASYGVVPSWGFAILFLTLVVKLLTLYWTQKSFVQMRRMASLKPMQDALREKYKDDKAKMNQAMMDLYKREKINPLGGCLPMLLQMPIWIALYRTIYASVDLYQAPLFLWITDLSAHDPYFVMPLLLGVLTFVQQKMTPTAGDPAQAKMMLWMMPIMFTGFMLFLPSGLVFYILVNTFLTIGHQGYMNRGVPKTVPARAGRKG